MLEDEEILQNQSAEMQQEIKPIENNHFRSPGSTLLRIMQYYEDEKETNQKPTNLKAWETFIDKYFSESVVMEVNIFENQILFHKIGNEIFPMK